MGLSSKQALYRAHLVRPKIVGVGRRPGPRGGGRHVQAGPGAAQGGLLEGGEGLAAGALGDRGQGYIRCLIGLSENKRNERDKDLWE